MVLLSASLSLLSCGGYSSSGTSNTSGIAYRAFFSEQVSAGTIGAGIYTVDAQNDFLPGIVPISAGTTPGKMVVTPNRAQTLVFSGYVGAGSDNVLTVITNAKESPAGGVTLPGFTESFVVTPDSNTAYVAVPTAPVVSQSPGAVKVISLSSVSFTGQVDIPSVRHLAINNSGTRVLGFSDTMASLAAPCDTTPSFVFVITPTDVGVQPCPAAPVHPNATYPFDHPVTAFFSSDDSTAFVVNCGAECAGTIASVQPLDMNTNTPGTAVPVPAATVGLMNGSTLYLAGTPVPATPCANQTTAATSCGLLTTFDLTSMSVTNAPGIAITDGYHTLLKMAANGQLFIGARTCTEIATSSETRGCLTIYNTLSVAVGTVAPNSVLIPAFKGDVTGIQPIAKRTVVYVVQDGSLTIYDATTDGLLPNRNFPNNPGQIVNLVGDFYDVKTIDF